MKMDYNRIFDVIYKLIDTNQLKEEMVFGSFVNSKFVLNSHMGKTKINAKFCTVEVSIGENMYLLIEDLPINFLLSFTILVGDKADLVRFKLKGIDKIYISKREIYDTYISLDDVESVKDYNGKLLYGKKFDRPVKEIRLISEIEKYCEEKKKVFLNKIHVVSGERVENFVPTMKSSHYKFANELSIPLWQMIENNFIVDSVINIYDINKQISVINPKFERDMELEWYVDRKGNRIYNDVSNEYVLKPNIDRIRTKLSLNKSKVSVIMSKVRNFVISDNKGDFLVPIWRSTKTNNLRTFRSREEFKLTSGLDFREDYDFLSRTEIASDVEEFIIRKRYFLRRFIDIVESLDFENSNIKYVDDMGLVIALSYLDNIGNVEENSFIKKESLLTFNKTLSKVCSHVVNLSINFNNGDSKELIPETFLGKFFEVLRSRVSKKYLSFKSSEISKGTLLSYCKRDLQLLYRVLICINISESEMVFLKRLVIILTRCSDNFLDEIKRHNFNYENIENFKEIFDKLGVHFDNLYNNDLVLDVVKDLALVNEQMNYGNNVKVIFKEDFEEKYLIDDGYEVVQKDFVNFEEFDRIDYSKLINDYHDNYKEKIESVKKNGLYHKKVRIYEGFKTICDNYFFTAIVEKINN